MLSPIIYKIGVVNHARVFYENKTACFSKWNAADSNLATQYGEMEKSPGIFALTVSIGGDTPTD
jgi:hypothetical protein